jgi:SAM-dependent methyltransferase
MKRVILRFLAMTLFTSPLVASHLEEDSNLSHKERDTLSGMLDKIATRIRQRGDLPYVSVERQLELLRALSEFGLGRFLLERGGGNGYWTHYVVTHPQNRRISGLDLEGRPFSPLEAFLLNVAPTCLATQERFEIFKREAQKRLFSGISLASIPSGLMADLLDLDYSKTSHFSICAIDVDLESLTQSQKMAADQKLEDHCSFSQRDAWNLNLDAQFDLITSNGLSFYEPDNQKVVELYRQFFSALKPNGILITSFLTPPPVPGAKSEWDMKSVNLEHALLQKILFADILDCKWQTFRSEQAVRSQLLEAGFKEVEIIYDKAHIFPTAIAKK